MKKKNVWIGILCLAGLIAAIYVDFFPQEEADADVLLRKEAGEGDKALTYYLTAEDILKDYPYQIAVREAKYTEKEAQEYIDIINTKFGNTTFAQTSGCNSPQHGQGAFHSPRLLFSYSTSILEAPLTVGVDMSTCFLFQNVVCLFEASNNGSPSFPALAGYASISSANSTLIVWLRRPVGLFAPAIVIKPPGNIFCIMVLPLFLDFSFILSASTGVSRSMGDSFSFENFSAMSIVGCMTIIGDGS